MVGYCFNVNYRFTDSRSISFIREDTRGKAIHTYIKDAERISQIYRKWKDKNTDSYKMHHSSCIFDSSFLPTNLSDCLILGNCYDSENGSDIFIWKNLSVEIKDYFDQIKKRILSFLFPISPTVYHFSVLVHSSDSSFYFRKH